MMNELTANVNAEKRMVTPSSVTYLNFVALEWLKVEENTNALEYPFIFAKINNFFILGYCYR